MSRKDARTLSIRLDESEAARLKDFEFNTGIDAVTLGRRAIQACLNYHDQARSISFPLKLVPVPAKSGEPEIPAYLREDAPEFGGKKASA